MSNYIEINRQSWNKRTEAHLKSEFYDLENFLKGKSSQNDIELNLLGDIKGKTILHLQCHFGQDTISLGRIWCGSYSGRGNVFKSWWSVLCF